jgi:hypothetical protein
LRNRANQGRNNIRKHERHVNLVVGDDFDEMGDENYDSASLSHEDQFGKPRNHRYEGVM